MSVFDHPDFDKHEEVLFFTDAATGMRAIIAIHSTALGPGGGGVRLWSYESSAAALKDALRLSRAMSYKNAMAGLRLGGGKAVLMKPAGGFDRPALFAAFGRALHKVGGRYFTAEDVGCTAEDMRVIRGQTPYVAGLAEGKAASGEPSPKTAHGVFLGIKAAAKHKFGSDDLSGRTVAVQGVGHVGFKLCGWLHGAGARLVVSDINDTALRQAAAEFGAHSVDLDAIYDQPADIFAPCALGGSISPATIDRLKVPIVAGAANNQLSEDKMGAALAARGILYAPDYVINAGGIINVAFEVEGAYDEAAVDRKVEAIAGTLESIFREADKTRRPTNEIADEMARARIAAGRR